MASSLRNQGLIELASYILSLSIVQVVYNRLGFRKQSNPLKLSINTQGSQTKQPAVQPVLTSKCISKFVSNSTPPSPPPTANAWVVTTVRDTVACVQQRMNTPEVVQAMEPQHTSGNYSG